MYISEASLESLRYQMLFADPDPSDEQADYTEEADRLAQSFGLFHVPAFNVLEPGIDLIDEWYLDALRDHGEWWLKGVEAGGIKDLMIHIRPRMLKTITLSIALSAWGFTWWPTMKILLASHNNERKEEIVSRTRDLITSDWYQQRWQRPFARAKDKAARFALESGGQLYSAIYGTGATGDGGNRLILDDPQSGSDQDSPTGLQRDEEWFANTWQRRRDDEKTSGMMIVTQRLGDGSDLCGRLRANDPQRWDVLSLQTRRTLVQVATYWRRNGEEIELPLTDTLLSFKGMFTDPRAEGELLSSRVDGGELKALEETFPDVYAAQEQQAPVRRTAHGAAFSAFTREKHVGSFNQRMGVKTLQEAIHKALSERWHLSAHFDHGTGGGREWCLFSLHNDNIKEMWTVIAYVNPTVTTIKEDGEAIRLKMVEYDIPSRVVEGSLGDVGKMGQGSERPSQTYNEFLSEYLGFYIGTPTKGRGSVDRDVADINVALGSGGVFVDESCRPLVQCIENWRRKSEVYKDGCDAWRYKVADVVRSWINGGRSGVVSG